MPKEKKGKAYCQTYTEEDIQKALDYLHHGHTTNISAAAKRFGVKVGTLCYRWLGTHGPGWHAHERQQHLNIIEEHVLCDWIEHRSDIGHPLNK